MKLASSHELPDELLPVLRRAVRLEVATIVYMLSVIVVMYLAMGSSQAMKTAWIEDILTLIPPTAFLITARLRRRPASERFPYGHHRSVSIAFLCAALALLGFGALLSFESVSALVRRERPTIGSVVLFGEVVWLGWLMLPVLLYSAIGAVILGRLKLAPAKELHDKTLHTDAQMNKADWLTALAAGLGVIGIGLGWWWADATAALIISLDVLRDGARGTLAGVQDLMDRCPERVDHSAADPVTDRIVAALRGFPWVRGAEVRVRESGHVLFAEAFVAPALETQDLPRRLREAADAARAVDWRVSAVTIQPVALEELASEA